ncbi:hypothetical protein [Thermicanus aegyptius]|uniref:hypothetical protein n=1 Tax=Thermicanus aegyptius TaxID=94009 RepID=UPI0004129390|nr:hypothetical protein [Thermicanus aegyptius]
MTVRIAKFYLDEPGGLAKVNEFLSTKDPGNIIDVKIEYPLAFVVFKEITKEWRPKTIVGNEY